MKKLIIIIILIGGGCIEICAQTLKPLFSRPLLLGIGTSTTGVTIAANPSSTPYTLQLPLDDGAISQLLTTDGNGVLSWTSLSDGTMTGSGTPGQITFWNSTSSLTSSANLQWDNANGRLGIGTAANVKADVNGAIAFQPATYSATSASSTLTVGDRSYIRISADDTPGNRTLQLSNGLRDGQLLIIECTTNSGNGVRINDGDANISTNGNQDLNNHDSLMLIWNGSLGKWMEISSINNNGGE
jgi:hypothetical protein